MFVAFYFVSTKNKEIKPPIKVKTDIQIQKATIASQQPWKWQIQVQLAVKFSKELSNVVCSLPGWQMSQTIYNVSTNQQATVDLIFPNNYQLYQAIQQKSFSNDFMINDQKHEVVIALKDLPPRLKFEAEMWQNYCIVLENNQQREFYEQSSQKYQRSFRQILQVVIQGSPYPLEQIFQLQKEGVAKKIVADTIHSHTRPDLYWYSKESLPSLDWLQAEFVCYNFYRQNPKMAPLSYWQLELFFHALFVFDRQKKIQQMLSTMSPSEQRLLYQKVRDLLEKVGRLDAKWSKHALQKWQRSPSWQNLQKRFRSK
jgi:hypothetical protein